MKLDLVLIKHFSKLLKVCFGIAADLFVRQLFPGGGFSCWITDFPREIADQELDDMSVFLKLTKLIQDDGVAQMYVRRRRIEAELNFQRFAGQNRFGQLCPQFLRGMTSSAPSIYK